MADIKHLSARHKLAFELKYKGHSYQSIADALKKKFPKSRPAKFNEQTIKDWFKENGRLYKAYCVYESEMDQIHAETMEIVRKAGARIREENFRLANEMLVALMGSSNDAVKLAAIKEILDRVEGKQKEISFGPYPEITLVEARKRREEARQMLKDGVDPSAVKKEDLAREKAKRDDAENKPHVRIDVDGMVEIWKGRSVVRLTKEESIFVKKLLIRLR